MLHSILDNGSYYAPCNYAQMDVRFSTPELRWGSERLRVSWCILPALLGPWWGSEGLLVGWYGHIDAIFHVPTRLPEVCNLLWVCPMLWRARVCQKHRWGSYGWKVTYLRWSNGGPGVGKGPKLKWTRISLYILLSGLIFWFHFWVTRPKTEKLFTNRRTRETFYKVIWGWTKYRRMSDCAAKCRTHLYYHTEWSYSSWEP